MRLVMKSPQHGWLMPGAACLKRRRMVCTRMQKMQELDTALAEDIHCRSSTAGVTDMAGLGSRGGELERQMGSGLPRGDNLTGASG